MGVTLVVLAAGLGSRFGGGKQTAAVDDAGHAILDYSIYDAHQAGFDKVVCVIAPGADEAFDEAIGARIRRHVPLVYAHQQLSDVPAGFEVPDGRVKPWGTAHAVVCALDAIDGPFVAINADDFYGRHAFVVMADYLRAPGTRHAMVAYRLANTLSEHGTVSRGVCHVAADGRLVSVVERTAIEEAGEACVDRDSGITLATSTPVSMNFWGFRAGAGADFRAAFDAFLATQVPGDPLRAEFYLPWVANRLVDEPGIQVLDTPDRWFGLTYADDLPFVRDGLAALRRAGEYPAELWP